MSDESAKAVGRPFWSYFKFPAGVIAIVAGAAGIGALHPFDAFSLAFVLLVLWLAWSMASGLYPWSMRL